MELSILLTGATGNMGRQALRLLCQQQNFRVKALARDTLLNHKILLPYLKQQNFSVVWGDIYDFETVLEAVHDVDIVLHTGALVSPAADLHPQKAMEVNYGGTLNLLEAIADLGKNDTLYFVNIGTIAETGDRMPPIHWGRIGDPIKPSIYDYYAVSKVAAERIVIESKIKNWVSLRQTGMMSKYMTEIRNPIITHNHLYNVLEYVSDRDSGLLLLNLCRKLRNGKLPGDFWHHIYNIGGGKTCRANSLELISNSFKCFGIKEMGDVFNPRWFATRNFHGHYYLDSDRLNDILEFRTDSMNYFYDSFEKGYGYLTHISRAAAKIPPIQGLIKKGVKATFKRLAYEKHGTMHAVKNNLEPKIAAFWSNRQVWEQLPDNLKDFPAFNDWDKVILINHGYPDKNTEALLSLEDVCGAALHRGGKCLSKEMRQGDWRTKLQFRCAFGHTFEASPRLILQGGHWCPVCENKSWNYSERAKVDPFFAEVWTPLHHHQETPYEYPKIVSPENIQNIIQDGKTRKTFVEGSAN